jgi:hypothetical protein
MDAEERWTKGFAYGLGLSGAACPLSRATAPLEGEVGVAGDVAPDRSGGLTVNEGVEP